MNLYAAADAFLLYVLKESRFRGKRY